MKKLLLSLVLTLGAITFSNAQESKIKLDWEQYFKNAIAKSKKEERPLFVFFTGSDWCGPCKKVEHEVLETEKFKNYVDKYLVIYKADFPKDKNLVPKQNRDFNKQLKKRFKQFAFPTLVVMDHNGNELGKIEGIKKKEEYYPFFEEMVEKIKLGK